MVCGQHEDYAHGASNAKENAKSAYDFMLFGVHYRWFCLMNGNRSFIWIALPPFIAFETNSSENSDSKRDHLATVAHAFQACTLPESMLR